MLISIRLSMSLWMVQMSKYLLFDIEKSLIRVYRVDTQLNCIKGGGACHLREKVLAEAATTQVSCILQNISTVSFLAHLTQVHLGCRLSQERRIPRNKRMLILLNLPRTFPHTSHSSSKQEYRLKSCHSPTQKFCRTCTKFWTLPRPHCEWLLPKVYP